MPTFQIPYDRWLSMRCEKDAESGRNSKGSTEGPGHNGAGNPIQKATAEPMGTTTRRTATTRMG
jgi:hypothetical protein